MAEIPPGFEVESAIPSGFQVEKKPLARDLPEIGSSRAFNELTQPSFLAALGVMSATGQDEQAQILKTQFPDAEIIEDAQGNLIARFEDGDFAINKPGLSARDVSNFAFRALAFLPSGKTAQFAGTTAQQVGRRVAQVAGQSAATEAGLQAVEAGVGGEFDPGEIAAATTAGIGGQAVTEVAAPVVRGVAAARGRRAVRRGMETEFPEAAARIPEVGTTEARGLSRAQFLDDPFLLEEQAFVGQLPEGARPAIQFLSRQNEEASNMVRGLIDDFGTQQSVIVGPRTLRDKSQKAVELVKATRAAKSSPLYQQAFREFKAQEQRVDVTPVLEFIDQQMQRFPKGHVAHKTLNTLRQDVVANADDLERLQGVKETADLEIARFAGQDLPAINKAKRALSDTENILLRQMDEVSPTFRDARETFAMASAPVDSIRASLVGRVSEISDERLKSVAGSIFDPDATNPALVKQARKAITSMPEGDEAWEGIVRVELERRLGRVRAVGEDLSTLAGQDISNLPSQFRTALFPNKKSKDVLFASMSPEQIDAAKTLETWLIRASKGRPGGSQTGIRREISERFDKGFTAALRKFLSQPTTTVAEIGEEAARSNRIKSVAEAIFSPDWVPEFNRIRRLAGQQEERFLELFNQVSLGGKAVIQAGRPEIEQTEGQ